VNSRVPTSSRREPKTDSVSTLLQEYVINPLDSEGNYSATSNNTKLVHWLLMGHGWAVTFGTARRGMAGLRPRPVRSPPRCTKYNSPPINGQCTDDSIAMVRCSANVTIKGLSPHRTASVLRDGDVLLFVCLIVCSPVANAY